MPISNKLWRLRIHKGMRMKFQLLPLKISNVILRDTLWDLDKDCSEQLHWNGSVILRKSYHWQQRNLSKWQLSLQPVTKMSSKWQHFRFHNIEVGTDNGWYFSLSRPCNSLAPSDTIWRQRSGSTLAHVMACCLTAPSRYLNQYYFFLSTLRSYGNHPRALSWEDLKINTNKARMRLEFLKSYPDLPGTSELNEDEVWVILSTQQNNDVI